MSTPPKKRTARLTPRPVAEWSPERYHALAAFRSPSTERVSSPSPKRRTSPGNNALGTFACYPELAKAYLTFNGHVLYGSSLPARMRELLVLRVAVLRRCEYEWAQHVVLADTAGISPQEIDWIVEGPDRPEWGELDRSLLRAADELVAEADVGRHRGGVGFGRDGRERTDDRPFDVVPRHSCSGRCSHRPTAARKRPPRWPSLAR